MIGSAFFETLRAVFTDRAVFLLLIGSAVMYSFFYPSAYSGEVAESIPIAVVDLDNTAASRATVSRLGSVQQARIYARASSADEALDLMKRRKIDAFILLPSGFQRSILRGEQGDVSLYGNGAFLLRSNASLTGIGQALTATAFEAGRSQSRAQGRPAATPLQPVSRPLFNTREGYGSSVVPAVTFLIIQQTMLMGLAMLGATLRERRGAHAFSPRGLLGISLASFAIGMGVILYWLGFVFWFQDYPRANADVGSLLVSAFIFVAATVACSLAIASCFQVRERPIQIWIVTSLPIYFLSNVSWPSEATPVWLQIIGRLLPSTPGIHLMIGTNQMGASLAEQWPEIANLLMLTVLYGAIAAWRLMARQSTEQRAVT